MKLLLFQIFVAGFPSSRKEKKGKGCSLTNDQLAERTGVTKRSVDGDIRRLQLGGWLIATGKGSKRVLIYSESGDPMKAARRKKHTRNDDSISNDGF